METQRHSHLYPLKGLSGLLSTSVCQLTTLRLCLSEIDSLIHQLLLQTLDSLECRKIETWCALGPLDMPGFILTNSLLQQVTLQFSDVSGFTSILAKPLTTNDNKIHKICIVNLRDTDQVELTRLVTEIELIQDQDVYDDNDYGSDTVNHNDLVSRWQAFESMQLDKYGWISQLPNLRHFSFGYCHSWSAAVWRNAVLPRCSTLETLELHGWMRLNSPLRKQLLDHSYPQLSVQKHAEDAISSCFAELGDHLQTLKLVDFWASGSMKLPTPQYFRHIQQQQEQQQQTLTMSATATTVAISSNTHRKKIILQYTSESFKKEESYADLMLNDIYDFIIYHRIHYEVSVQFDSTWEPYHQQWLEQRN
ncbi:hypothetical protein BDC45DRAFT_343666 [Circinella umbellata]|nr:hypothetical protein BDC45DRAFT_343666 [Circinella umbellata]